MESTQTTTKSATKVPFELPGTILFGRKTVVELPSWVTMLNSWSFGLTFILSAAIGYVLAAPFMAFHVARQAYTQFVAKRAKEEKVQGMNTDTATYDENGILTSLSASYPVEDMSVPPEDRDTTDFSHQPSSVVAAVCGGQGEKVAAGEAD
jgi:hypothetical protein